MIHLYCLAVQAGFLQRRGRVLDFRTKGPRFDPRPGHEFFLSVRDKWRPTEITHLRIRTS